MSFSIGSIPLGEREDRMLRVKVRRIRDGLHPNEVVVGFDTPDGTQETLVVDRRSLRSDDTLRVGYPVGSDQANRRLLVELPGKQCVVNGAYGSLPILW